MIKLFRFYYFRILKNEIKIVVVFVLTILVYGASYLFTEGKFAFPLHYFDLSLSLLSLYFILKAPFSQFTLIVLTFGFSFSYLFFGINGVDFEQGSLFMFTRGISIFVFSLLLMLTLAKKQNTSYRTVFILFFLLVIGQSVLNVFLLEQHYSLWVDLLKNALFFVVSIKVLTIQPKELVNKGVLFMFTLLGLYYFRNIMWVLVDNDLMN